MQAYRAAYAALAPSDAERTFVILGTSHYGEPDLDRIDEVAVRHAVWRDDMAAASLVDELSRGRRRRGVVEEGLLPFFREHPIRISR